MGHGQLRLEWRRGDLIYCSPREAMPLVIEGGPTIAGGASLLALSVSRSEGYIQEYAVQLTRKIDATILVLPL